MTTKAEDLRLVRVERDLHAHVELFRQHVKTDEEAFESLQEHMEKLEVSMDTRFDRLELLLTDLRIHTARREGADDAIKKVVGRTAGYISTIVAAAVTALGVAIQKLFLE